MKKSAGIRIFLFKSVVILFYTAAIACACEAAATPTFTPTVTATLTSTPVVSSIWRVNTGGSLYPDSWGNTWSADSNFNSGTAHCVTNTVVNTNDSGLYQCERFGDPFTYTFNVPAGSYQVTLKFAELYHTAAGARVFNVLINGATVLNGYDIFADTGSEFMAVSKVFNNISPAGGLITIQFGPATADNAQVCAIQINPQPPSPTPTPTLAVTACGTPGITPFIQVNGGAWQQLDSITASIGSNVTLGPQPLTGGSWSWTGPSGFTSNLREISGIPLSSGLNTFTTVFTDGCGSQASMAFNVTVVAATPASLTVTASCAGGISIDGIMNEPAWASAVLNPVSKLCVGTNPNGISGGFKTLWDTDSLYVGLIINDSYLNATQVACNNYNDSSVEIFLDMANDRGSQPYPGSVGDFHFMISYDCLQSCLNAAVAIPPGGGGIQYASTYNVSGYIMEVRIPWLYLAVNPVIGADYGFDVQVNFNNGTYTRVGQLAWNGDKNDWKSSANLGDINLGYCPSPTATATPVPPSLTESFHVFPNPVNPKQSQAHFNYNISHSSEISIDIFTISGNHVRTVVDKAIKPAGQHTEDLWDAKNESGMEVLSGVYLCVLKAKDKQTGGTTKLEKKLAVLR
jgi:hypothetical protein